MKRSARSASTLSAMASNLEAVASNLIGIGKTIDTLTLRLDRDVRCVFGLSGCCASYSCKPKPYEAFRGRTTT